MASWRNQLSCKTQHQRKLATLFFDPLSLPRSRSLPLPPLCVCLSLLSLCRDHHFPSLFSLYPTQDFNFLHPSVLKPPPPQLLSDSLAPVTPAVIDVARLDLPFSLSLPPPPLSSPADLSDSPTRTLEFQTRSSRRARDAGQAEEGLCSAVADRADRQNACEEPSRHLQRHARRDIQTDSLPRHHDLASSPTITLRPP